MSLSPPAPADGDAAVANEAERGTALEGALVALVEEYEAVVSSLFVPLKEGQLLDIAAVDADMVINP
jgi:hypothetical protein